MNLHGLFSPKSRTVRLVLSVIFNDPFQQGIIHRLLPADAEQIGALAVSGSLDFPGKFPNCRRLRRHGEMLLRGAETDYKRAMIRKNGLVPRNFRLQTGKPGFCPFQNFAFERDESRFQSWRDTFQKLPLLLFCHAYLIPVCSSAQS